MKEIAFFTISIFEIVLTAFIVYKILRAKEDIEASDNKFKKNFPKKLEDFRLFTKKLSLAKTVLQFHTKYSYAIEGAQKILEILSGFSKIAPILKFLGFRL